MLSLVIAVSMQGAVAATASKFALIQTGALIGQEVLSLAASPKGTQFVAGLADNTVRIYDAKTRLTVKTFKGNTLPPRAVAWSPLGDKIASGSENTAVRIWDVKTGKELSMWNGGHLRNINGIWFSPDAKRVITTSDDDTTKIWDIATKKAVVTILGGGANIYGSRFDVKGTKIFAATLGKGFQIYSPAGANIKALGGHPGQGCDDVDVNVAGTLGATAGRDWAVGLWDMKKNTRLSYLRGHGDWVSRVMFDPTGQYIASSSTDMTVRIWDAKAMKQVAIAEEMQPTGSPLAWVDGGNFLVSVGSDGYPRMFAFIRPTPPIPAKRITKTTKRKG